MQVTLLFVKIGSLIRERRIRGQTEMICLRIRHLSSTNHHGRVGSHHEEGIQGAMHLASPWVPVAFSRQYTGDGHQLRVELLGDAFVGGRLLLCCFGGFCDLTYWHQRGLHLLRHLVRRPNLPCSHSPECYQL